MIEAGIDMVVAEANVRYLAPLRFDEEFDLVADGAAGSATTSTDDRGRDASATARPVAEGELRHVVVDLETREKAPIPDSCEPGSSRTRR